MIKRKIMVPPVRIAAAIFAIAFILPAATGCGGGGGGGTAATAPPPSTITVAGRVIVPFGADRDFAAKLIEEDSNLNTSGTPLSGATVAISGTSLSATTDSMGNFTISGAPANTALELSATKSGLTLFKGVPASSEKKNLIVNYQTSAAYLYYKNVKADMPDGADIEWIEWLAVKNSNLRSAASIFKSLAQDYGSRKSITPPHLDESFTSAITASEIPVPPYLSAITISPARAVPGSSVTISATTYCPQVITGFSVSLQHKDDFHLSDYWNGSDLPERTLQQNKFNLATKIGDRQQLEMTVDIPPYFPAGEYYISELRLQDIDYNYTYFTGIEERELFSGYLYRDMPTLAVTSTAPDTTAPELVLASLSSNIISSRKEIVTLTVNTRDTQSGAKAMILYYSFAREGYTSAASSIPRDFSFGADDCDSSGNCSAEFTFSGFSLARYGPGTFTFDDIAIMDNARNVLETSLDGLTFQSTLPQEISTKPPLPNVTDNLTINSFSISAGEGSSVVLNVSVNYTGDATELRFSGFFALGDYETNRIDNTFSFSISPLYNGATGKWEGSATYYYNDFTSEKDIFPNSMYLYSNSKSAYERSEYRCNDDDESYGSCDGLGTLSYTIPANSRVDSDPPTLVSVSLTPQSVARGDDVTITVSATENGSGLRSVIINLDCNDCSGEYEYDTISISLDNMEYLGSGSWRASVSIPITSRKSLGVWTLERVGLQDFADNSKYYYDTSTLPDYTTGPLEFYVE